MSSDEPAELEPNGRPKPAPGPIDTRLVRKLADILKDTGLTEIEVQRGDLRIRVARAAPAPAPATLPQAAPAAPVVAAPAMPSDPAAPPAPAAAPATAAKGEVVKSPMVGTVYLSAQPGSEPFAKIGDRVAQGQTLLIIEAMKTMNPIPAPRAGTLVEMLVEDGQPVEFGESLLAIE